MPDAEVRGSESRVETTDGRDPTLSAVSPARPEAGDGFVSEDWPWCAHITGSGLRLIHTDGRRLDMYQAQRVLNELEAKLSAVPPSVSGGQPEPDISEAERRGFPTTSEVSD